MKVSIIIPAYNAQDYLAECVVSACEQSHPDVEVIVVDDGSTDETAAVLKELERHWPDRIKSAHLANTGGPGAPRNAGIEMATGDFVMFLDADDVLPRNAAELLVQASVAADADVVLGKRMSFSGTKRWVPASHARVLQHVMTRRPTLYGCPDLFHVLGPSAKLIRRSILMDHEIRFPRGLTYGEDHLFSIKAFLFARKIHAVQENVYDYRFHVASASNTLNDRGILSYANALRDIIPFFESAGLSDLRCEYEQRRILWDVLRFARNSVMEGSEGRRTVLKHVQQVLALFLPRTLHELEPRTRLKAELLKKGAFARYVALETLDSRVDLAKKAQGKVRTLASSLTRGKLSQETESKMRNLFGRFLPVDDSKVVFAPAFRDHGNVTAVRNAFVASGVPGKHVMVRHPENNWRRQVRRAYHLATARVTVLESYYSPLYDMPLKSEQEVVQLWHGAGSFKRFGLSAVDRIDSNDRDFEVKAHAPYTRVVVSAESVRDHYADAFGIASDKITPLGFPRSDLLFRPSELARLANRAYARYPELRRRRVLAYLPTFRGSPRVRGVLPPAFAMDFIADLPPDYMLAIKPHPEMRNTRYAIPPQFEDRVVLVDHDLPVMELLAVTDVLLTDYSSVIFEFATLGRPMIFYAPDLESYHGERGFYWDYKSFVPGPLVSETDQIGTLISEGRFDLARVKKFSRTFHQYSDGRSAERVVRNLLIPLISKAHGQVEAQPATNTAQPAPVSDKEGASASKVRAFDDAE